MSSEALQQLQHQAERAQLIGKLFYDCGQLERGFVWTRYANGLWDYWLREKHKLAMARYHQEAA